MLYRTGLQHELKSIKETVYSRKDMWKKRAFRQFASLISRLRPLFSRISHKRVFFFGSLVRQSSVRLTSEGRIPALSSTWIIQNPHDWNSRYRRVVTRCIVAGYNVAFLKLPLKTAVFRGSLYVFTNRCYTVKSHGTKHKKRPRRKSKKPSYS